MSKQKENQIKISVRSLVEFILRSGDIDNRRAGPRDMEAMQEGSRIHRKIQKSQGDAYTAEVPLSICIPYEKDGHAFEICIEGRADGIIWNYHPDLDITNLSDPMNAYEDEPEVTIDEIKGIYMDLNALSEPFSVHKAQAMCYAYIYAKQNELSSIGVRLTYCNIETEDKKFFNDIFTLSFLEQWFFELVHEYGKWAGWQIVWMKQRNSTIKNLEFPFEYRQGQRDLVVGVYKTIIRERKLFIEAPTGVGKTISTVFPAIKSMGEGFLQKIFYLTAKTITRTVAEETFSLLNGKGLKLIVVTITAKDKVCILNRPDCNPSACERARGHYDRVNRAVFDLITHETDISREILLDYAKKHMVCPHEMCLDVTLWADAVICDYNYVFDPKVALRRFFLADKKSDFVFLIDEAHNLVERGREMYSAFLFKDKFLEVKRLITNKSGKLTRRLSVCNKDLLELKRECDVFGIQEDIQEFILHLMRLISEYEEFLQEFPSFENRDLVLEFYFELRHFLSIYEIADDKYVFYTDYHETEGFRLKLQCMDPSKNLLGCLKRGRSAVFFSATLLPIQYYKEQLGGEEEDYAVYAPSPFDASQRLLMIAGDVSTKYSKRTDSEYKKILEYILSFTRSKQGNYLVFFPSYSLMRQTVTLAMEGNLFETEQILIQENNMSEEERENFLGAFQPNPVQTLIGFCVMGGIFSEGIDLKQDSLIGAVIVGTGLPMVCDERELFRQYYERMKGAGFNYSYLYNGMNKVLQSAGRVIRTSEDKGAILLLDERFRNRQYQNLFPREWFPNEIVNKNRMELLLNKFWNSEWNQS